MFYLHKKCLTLTACGLEVGNGSNVSKVELWSGEILVSQFANSRWGMHLAAFTENITKANGIWLLP